MTASILLSDNGVASGVAGIKPTGGNDGTLALQTTNSAGTALTGLTIDNNQNVALNNGLNTPNTFGFKNRIINGGMVINQRNASALTSGIGTLTYGLDRFFAYATGAAVTVSQYTGVNFGSATTSVLQVTGASSNTAFNVGQRIEASNIRDLAGQSVTFSAWVYQTTGSTQTFIVNAYTPTATDNWASQNTYSSVVTASVPSGVWTFVSGSFTLNSTAQYGAGVSFGNFALGSGQQFAVGNVQLEKGTSATSFDFRSYGTELALCQRYYYKLDSVARNDVYLQAGDDYFGCFGLFPSQMRTAPTPTLVSSTNMSSVSLAGTTAKVIQVSTGANPTSQGYYVDLNGSSFSAEL